MFSFNLPPNFTLFLSLSVLAVVTFPVSLSASMLPDINLSLFTAVFASCAYCPRFLNIAPPVLLYSDALSLKGFDLRASYPPTRTTAPVTVFGIITFFINGFNSILFALLIISLTPYLPRTFSFTGSRESN